MSRILVVDDDPWMAEMIREILDNEYEVVAANNGQEGLLMAQIVKPDLLITDMEMPLMNGLELVKSLHRLTPKLNIPIVAVSTAFHDSEESSRMLAIGVACCFSKPINFKLFQQFIKQLPGMKTMLDLDRDQSAVQQWYN